jgi:hypothetical protein
MEATRIRLVADPAFGVGVRDAFPRLLRERGWGIYAGLPAILSKHVPGNMAQLASYELSAALGYSLALSFGLLGNPSAAIAISVRKPFLTHSQPHLFSLRRAFQMRWIKCFAGRWVLRLWLLSHLRSLPSRATSFSPRCTRRVPTPSCRSRPSALAPSEKWSRAAGWRLHQEVLVGDRAGPAVGGSVARDYGTPSARGDHRCNRADDLRRCESSRRPRRNRILLMRLAARLLCRENSEEQSGD